MFVMLNDGGAPEDTDYDMITRVLVQRGLIFDVLTSGVSVALLYGAEFRDSKVGCYVPWPQNLYKSSTDVFFRPRGTIWPQQSRVISGFVLERSTG